jgi:putative ABC transport system ATP-binding protein
MRLAPPEQDSHDSLDALVTARDLVKDYDADGQVVHALRGVTLEVPRGDFVAVLGPSGCGKSTLLHLLGAVDVPTGGALRWFGRDAATFDDAARTALRLRHFGFVFQRFFLLPMLSAAENVALPLLEAGMPRPQRDERVAEVLDWVGVAHRARHRPGQMSGGEQQRVAIARALVHRPPLVLADEPTGELDESTGLQIVDLLSRIHAGGTALVLVTHNPALGDRAARRLHMRDGRIVEASR